MPTGNIDLAPTALHLLGIELTDTIEGRVLHELFVGGRDFDDVPLRRLVHTAQAAHQVADEDVITYQLKLHVSTVDGVPYFSKAVVSRDDPQAAAAEQDAADGPSKTVSRRNEQ